MYMFRNNNDVVKTWHSKTTTHIHTTHTYFLSLVIIICRTTVLYSYILHRIKWEEKTSAFTAGARLHMCVYKCCRDNMKHKHTQTYPHTNARAALDLVIIIAKPTLLERGLKVQLLRYGEAYAALPTPPVAVEWIVSDTSIWMIL